MIGTRSYFTFTECVQDFVDSYIAKSHSSYSNSTQSERISTYLIREFEISFLNFQISLVSHPQALALLMQ
jgi:hypothetical protein